MPESIPANAAPADLVGFSIVMTGAFDPMYLQPSYLAERGLLAEGDFAELRYQILAPEVSVLLLPWMQLTVEPNRLTASTTLQNPIPEPVSDFVFAFYDALQVRAVTAIGLNQDTHFAVRSEEVWHKIGHELVPKDQLWKSILVEPGTASVGIKAKRDDALEGAINVRVEPSSRLHPGIYVNVNDHLDVGTLDSDRLVSAAGDQLAASKERSDKIIAALKRIAE